MKLHNAMPTILTALFAAGLTIAQPGKLSVKAANGLGILSFLGVAKGFTKMSETLLNKRANKDEKNPEANKLNREVASSLIGTMAGVAAFSLVTGALARGLRGKSSSKSLNFIASEGKQLAKEIDSTKLGKFVSEKFNPFARNFANNHPKAVAALSFALPFGTIMGAGAVDKALVKNISKDFKEQAEFNFIKGKTIQKEARAHFDSVDAIEV